QSGAPHAPFFALTLALNSCPYITAPANSDNRKSCNNTDGPMGCGMHVKSRTLTGFEHGDTGVNRAGSRLHQISSTPSHRAECYLLRNGPGANVAVCG